MCDFPDTDLLYRDAGGEQRKLIDQAKRLYDRLDDLTSTRDTPDTTYYRLSYLRNMAASRYQRRYQRYYKQEA